MNRCCQNDGSNLNPVPGNPTHPRIPHFPSDPTDTLRWLTLIAANCSRKVKLAAIRARLKEMTEAAEISLATVKMEVQSTDTRIEHCPKCHQGQLQAVYLIEPKPLLTGG